MYNSFGQDPNACGIPIADSAKSREQGIRSQVRYFASLQSNFGAILSEHRLRIPGSPHDYQVRGLIPKFVAPRHVIELSRASATILITYGEAYDCYDILYSSKNSTLYKLYIVVPIYYINNRCIYNL